jgi:hypothetical protein
MRKRIIIRDPSERVLPESEAQKFRAQYNLTQTDCLCGKNLSLEDILYYVPHGDGWTIQCETEKVWLYVKCPKCGYDMSIWKMGVNRE